MAWAFGGSIFRRTSVKVIFEGIDEGVLDVTKAQDVGTASAEHISILFNNCFLPCIGTWRKQVKAVDIDLQTAFMFYVLPGMKHPLLNIRC